MDFKTFYDHLIIEIGKRRHTDLFATQGDNRSRGFYLTVKQGNATVVAHFLLPTREKKKINGIKEGNLIRVDIPTSYFDVAGTMLVEFELQGAGGQSITDETLMYHIKPSIAMEG